MNLLTLLFSFFLFLTSCSANENQKEETVITESNTELKANIVSVSTSGEAGNYTFSVGISSPDKGCEQYANWWEVISEDGKTLIYRRILGHSHVNEQPFVRSGGTVAISNTQVVIIRAHMNTSGYGTTVFKGAVSTGFTKYVITDEFANNLETQAPQPSNCTF